MAVHALSQLTRFHMYGVHGLFLEVIFTAMWDIYLHQSPKLPGNSSAWAYIVYSVHAMGVEQIYLSLHNRIPIYVRGVIYIFWTYMVEFGIGYLLLRFDACPWDYKPWFDYHLMGIVTLEYAPLWFFASILGEQFVIKPMLRLRWDPNNEIHGLASAGTPRRSARGKAK